MRVAGRKTRIPWRAMPQTKASRLFANSAPPNKAFDLNPEGATLVTGFVNRNIMDPNTSSGEVASHSYSGELLGHDETCPLAV